MLSQVRSWIEACGTLLLIYRDFEMAEVTSIAWVAQVA